jgi:hypothetical protein
MDKQIGEEGKRVWTKEEKKELARVAEKFWDGMAEAQRRDWEKYKETDAYKASQYDGLKAGINVLLLAIVSILVAFFLFR